MQLQFTFSEIYNIRLIDEIATLQSVLEEKYHGVKIQEVMKDNVPQGGIHNTQL